MRSIPRSDLTMWQFLYQILKKNNVYTFSNRPDPHKKSCTVGVQKQNTALIAQLFLSLQSRPEDDMTEFLQKWEPTWAPLTLRSTVPTRDRVWHSCISECTIKWSRTRSTRDSPTPIAWQGCCQGHPYGALVQSYMYMYSICWICTHTLCPVSYSTDDGYRQAHRCHMGYTYPEQSLKTLTQQWRDSGALDRDGDGTTPMPKQDQQSYLKYA